jgi:hypothetical protein
LSAKAQSRGTTPGRFLIQYHINITQKRNR